MLFNVAGLLTAPTGTVRRHTLDNERLVTGQGAFEEISGPVTMLRTDRTILVEASVSAVTHDTCGRCLAPATVHLNAEIEEEFYPLNADLIGAPRMGVWEETALDEALLIDSHNMLDMRELVRQALLGSMPIAPLCSPDCRGLCPQCAADRNVRSCSCDEMPTDARWAPLAHLSQRS